MKRAGFCVLPSLLLKAICERLTLEMLTPKRSVVLDRSAFDIFLSFSAKITFRSDTKLTKWRALVMKIGCSKRVSLASSIQLPITEQHHYIASVPLLIQYVL